MEKEKFDPKDERYKEVADLPLEHQEEFMDVKRGGFVSKEAIFNPEKAKEIACIEENERELKKIRAEKLAKITKTILEFFEANKIKKLDNIFIKSRYNK